VSTPDPIKPTELWALKALAANCGQPYPLIRELYEEHRQEGGTYLTFQIKIEKASRKPSLFISIYYAES